jgi:hypothetical protein
VKPVAIYPTEIFISHSSKDAALAGQLCKDLMGVDLQAVRAPAGLPPGLEKDSFRVWAFENDLAFRDHRDPNIKDKIRDCDVFMMILPSPDDVSEWLQRELGLAMELMHKAKMRHPLIVPVLARPGVPEAMSARDFDGGALTGEVFNFAATRGFALASPSTDAFDDLVQSLLLKVYCFGTDSDDPDLIPPGPNGAFACYEDLFPID